MITDLAIIIYTYILLEIAVFGFGLVFAAITFRLKSFNLLSNLAQFTVIGLCGLFFPLSILPTPILAVSMAIPFTYFADMFRYAGYGGPTLLNPALEMVVALALAIGILLIGLSYFKATEKRAKERGLIGTH